MDNLSMHLVMEPQKLNIITCVGMRRLLIEKRV